MWLLFFENQRTFLPTLTTPLICISLSSLSKLLAKGVIGKVVVPHWKIWRMLNHITEADGAQFLFQNQYLHYWRSTRDSKGTKMSGRNHTIRIFRFLVQPHGFRAATGRIPSKKSQKSPKKPKFSRFLDSSYFKTTWLHQKLKNLNCVVSSQHFGTLAVPGAASIVENLVILSVFWP